MVPGQRLFEAGAVARVGGRKARQAILCLRQALKGGEPVPLDGKIGLWSTMNAPFVEAGEALLGTRKLEIGGAGEKIDGCSRFRRFRFQHVLGESHKRHGQVPLCRFVVPVDGAGDVDGAEETRLLEPGQVVLHVDVASGGTLFPGRVRILVAPFPDRLPAGKKSGIVRPGGYRQDQAGRENKTRDHHGPSIGAAPC